MGVQVGQVWEDTDKRRGRRRFKILEVRKLTALVEDERTGRRMHIALYRFDKYGRKLAYKLVGSVGLDASGR